MWLASCKRQGMLTHRPTPDLKCELNIASLLTLPHPLPSPVCAKDLMVIVLLLQVMRGMERFGGWLIYVKVWVGGHGVGIIFFLFFVLFLCFC